MTKRYKSKSNISIAKGIGAVLLAGVLAAGICCMGFAARNDDGKWFSNGNLSTWHWSDKDDIPQSGDIGGANIGESGALLPGEVKGNGIRLTSAVIPSDQYSEYGIEAQAESGYTVTATIEPEEATDKAVTYSAAFQSESAWSKGKNVSDYVTVTQSSAGSLTATIEIKQAFGEPVIITVTSDYTPEVSASFPVHYIKRITGVTSSVASELGAKSIALGKDTTYRCTPTLGVGTVAGDFEITAKITFMESYFWGPLQGNPYYTKAMNYSGLSGTKTPNTSGWALTLSSNNETAGTFRLTSSRDFFTIVGGGDYDTFYEYMNTAIYQTVHGSSAPGFGMVIFTVVNKYVDENGTEHFRESKTSTADIAQIDMSAVSIPVTSLSFPSGTVIYG